MNQTKPFNLEHASAGAPYASADGESATILKWDGRSEYPLIGVHGEADEPASWTAQGEHLAGSASGADLVMTPLGHIDGKPVFVGDLIVTGSWQMRACPKQLITERCRWPDMRTAEAERLARDLDVAEAVALGIRRLLGNQPAAVWQLLNREHLAHFISQARA